MHYKSADQFTQSQGCNTLSLKETMKSMYVVKLNRDGRAMPIGTIYTHGEGCFRCTRKPEHLHRSLNGWGINAELLERHEFKWVCVICDGKEYKTTRSVVLRHAAQRAYPGFERQYILPLDLWGIDRVKFLETSGVTTPTQLSLFGGVA